jgi:cyclopropane-fatty-acyl-phospholipid synthase
MHRDDALDTGMGMGGPTRQRSQSWAESALVRSLERALARVEIDGRLRLTLPSGRVETFGRNGAEAEVVLRSFSPLWAGLTRGSLGIVEAHLDGAIDSPDVGAVIRFGRRNLAAWQSIGTGLVRLRWLDRLWHRSRANTLSGSRRNIAAHYDLGNAFYALWLDPSMTYSSAIYRPDTASLPDAQATKIAAIVDALDLSPGQRVLEIGCGWGALAEAIALTGAHVTAITLSAEQLAYTNARIAAAHLGERVDARYCDYRHIDGTFDRIVSIEMIEAVGEENWPTYFQVLRDRLAPGGSAVLQAITIEAAHATAYRAEPDFIQRYIFPGGMLPTVADMANQSSRAGLCFGTIERFGPDYARTLADWRDRFDAAWPDIAALGYDERFRRMWRYYLSYCEVGFEAGDIDVGLYRCSRPLT